MNILYRSACILLLCALGGAGILRAQSTTWEDVTSPSDSQGLLAMATNATGRIFCSTMYGFVNYSDDLGETWTPVFPSNGSFAVVSTIASLPNGNLVAGSDKGAWITRDNGITWNPLSPQFTEYSDVYATRSGRIFLSSPSYGNFVTSDEGKSWKQILNGCSVQAAAENDNGMLFVGTVDSGVFRSSDGGATWNQTPLVETYVIGLAFTANGSLLAATRLPEGKGRVLRSPDNGNSWNTTTLRDISTQILPLPDGTIFATAVNSGVYRSTDDGRTWTTMNSGLADVRIFPIILHRSGKLFTADVFGHVYRSLERVAGASSAETAGTLRGRAIPNPASGSATIELATPVSGTAVIEMRDLLGRIVGIYREEMESAGAYAVTIDCSAMPAGAYFYRIRMGELSTWGKLVVER